MKKNIIKGSVAIVLFVSVSAITYGLGTWNTGYKAIDGSDTSVATNHSNPLDEFVVDNDHGYDLFIPTKTFGELKSVWDNTPANVELITGKESFANLMTDTTVMAYYPLNETYCDGAINKQYESYGTYISYRRYQILKIDVPDDIEAYLNIRGKYEGDQADENLYIFKQTKLGSTVTEERLHALYDDGTSTGWNPPVLDFDTDGVDDIEIHYIADVYDDGTSNEIFATAKTTTKIELFAGSNYFRVQTGDGSATGNHFCESGAYSNIASVHYDKDTSPEDLVWLSNN